MRYRIEGSICFMHCPVGTEPVFEFYQIHPDGHKEYIINARPIYIEEEKIDPLKMTLKEFLHDIAHCFKDKSIPLDEIKIKFYDKDNENELDYEGGIIVNEKEITLTFAIK